MFMDVSMIIKFGGRQGCNYERLNMYLCVTELMIFHIVRYAFVRSETGRCSVERHILLFWCSNGTNLRQMSNAHTGLMVVHELITSDLHTPAFLSRKSFHFTAVTASYVLLPLISFYSSQDLTSSSSLSSNFLTINCNFFCRPCKITNTEQITECIQMSTLCWQEEQEKTAQAIVLFRR